MTDSADSEAKDGDEPQRSGERRSSAPATAALADASFSNRYRFVVWGVTWLSYASYYVGRKGLSVAKKTMHDQLGVSTYAFASIETAYLVAYSIGQFVNGLLGDKLGARRLIGLGMLLSAACVALFGSVSAGILFGVFFTINGFAQSSGWPGNNRAMAEWTTPKNRGTVMAFWATCYMVGSIAANFMASRLLGLYGWRAAFHGPAIWLVIVAALVLFFVRPGPGARVSSTPGGEQTEESKELLEETRKAARRALLGSRTVWCFGGSYFCIKLIRYSLLFWLPYYLSKKLNYDALTASDVASAFEAGGIGGVIVIGLLSDRVRMTRSALSAISLLGLAGALLLYAGLGTPNVTTNVAVLALVGAMLYGPDSLLSGAAAQDAGGPHAAATAAGFVNGLGSVGAAAQGFVTATVSEHYGWQKLFWVFVVLAVIGAAALVPTMGRPEERRG
ncbi:MAG: MFS transporter [Polyangiaceae bacterium]